MRARRARGTERTARVAGAGTGQGAVRVPRHALAGGVAVFAMLVAGCGIRATSVPTDFGAAPSRAPCALSGPNIESHLADQSVTVQIFLVCSSQLVRVDRTVRMPPGQAGDRLRVAQALLDQLHKSPPTPERQAGYTTDLRDAIPVSGPRAADPADALRLGTPPEDLTAYALAQIVCTFANSAAAAKDGSVVIGGPDADSLRRYQCSPEVRSRPGTTAPPTSTVTR